MIGNLEGLFLMPEKGMDEETHGVVTLVRRWADKEVIGDRLEYRRNYPSRFDEKRKTLFLAMGLQRLAVPEEHGGFGWHTPGRMRHVLRVLTEIGRADCSTGVLLAMNCALFTVVTRFCDGRNGPTHSLASSYLEDEMKIASCILTGPGLAGRETPLFKGRSILARAAAAGESATVSGEDLRPLAAGLAADRFLIVCADSDGSPCLALVPADAPGITRSERIKAAGLDALANADISLDAVTIPKDHLILDQDAVSYLSACLNLMLGGVSLGAGLNFFEIVSDWSDSRVIKGGTVLKENPLCASVLADTAEEIACAGFLLHDLAGIMPLTDHPGPSGMEAVYTYSAMIGAKAQQGIMRAINRGLELMGSAGYAREWHAEKHWRDVKTIQSIMCGTGAEAPVKMDIARFFYNCSEI